MIRQDFSMGIKHQLFNNEVRSRRLERGLSQIALAIKCGLGKARISQIETFRKYPSEEQAKRISEALNSTIEELFPRWIEELKDKRTSIVTSQLVTERLLEHPELKMLPSGTDDIEQVVDEIDTELMNRELNKVLDTLNPREQKVLELRFGLKDGRPRTLEEVGKEFGVTRERIRQIEAKALRKLRHPARAGKLESYVKMR